MPFVIYPSLLVLKILKNYRGSSFCSKITIEVTTTVLTIQHLCLSSIIWLDFNPSALYVPLRLFRSGHAKRRLRCT